MGDTRRPTEFHLRKQWEAEQAKPKLTEEEQWARHGLTGGQELDRGELGIPEAARLPDEQIQAAFDNVPFEPAEGTLQEFRDYLDDWNMKAAHIIARAAEDHLWAYTRAEVEDLSGKWTEAQMEVYQLQEQVAELKVIEDWANDPEDGMWARAKERDDAQELSELWHLEAIAVRKAGCQIKEERDAAKCELEKYKEQTRKYLRGSAERLERRVESKESLDNAIDALREKGQELETALNDMRNAFDGAIGGIGVSGLEFTRRENAINKAEAALKDWDA